MKRRAPGQNAWSTPRKEEDAVVVDLLQKGLFKAHIDNTNIKPHDYSNLLITPRPGHADFTARLKYGEDFKSSGGGAFSGRMTAPLCIAGFLAKSFLEEKGVRIFAHIKSIAAVKDEAYNFDDRTNEEDFLKKLEEVSKKEFPVIDDAAGEQMKEKIAQAREQGDSVGGTIEDAISPHVHSNDFFYRQPQMVWNLFMNGLSIGQDVISVTFHFIVFLLPCPLTSSKSAKKSPVRPSPCRPSAMKSAR